MKKAPKIGQIVRYSHADRACTGTVEKIWPKRVVLNDQELIDNDDAMPRYGDLAKESEWQVTLKPEVIPTWWPYKKPDGTICNDKFCPTVCDLEADLDFLNAP